MFHLSADAAVIFYRLNALGHERHVTRAEGLHELRCWARAIRWKCGAFIEYDAGIARIDLRRSKRGFWIRSVGSKEKADVFDGIEPLLNKLESYLAMGVVGNTA